MTSMKLFAAAALLLFPVLSGCAGLKPLNPFTQVQTREATPRQAALEVRNTIGPVVREMADACAADLLSEDSRTRIANYGQPIRTAIGTYADTARPCLVVDGKLITDPNAEGACYRGSVQQASYAVPDVLKEVGLAVGGEIGKRAFMAGILATSLVSRGGAISADGFDPDVNDKSLKDFDDAWAPVQADADRLMACVAED